MDINYKQEMVNFIKDKGGQDKGGRVRFDVFAREHLLGEHGFYKANSEVLINRGFVGVETPSQSIEGYSTILAKAVFKLLYMCSVKFGVEKPVFVEIGGGEGNFKRDFLEIASGSDFECKFISVEPNSHQAKRQEFEGSEIVIGTAQNTGLPEESVDMVFDDEVIDCLPTRIFKLKKEGNVIYLLQEAYVKINNGNLEFFYSDVDKNVFSNSFEQYVNSFSSFFEDGEQVHVSEESFDYWRERYRILKFNGISVSTDYGTIKNDSIMSLMSALQKKITAAIPFAGARNALLYPYNADLTYVPDFQFQQFVCSSVGLSPSLMGNGLIEFIGSVLSDNDVKDIYRSNLELTLMSRPVIIAPKLGNIQVFQL